MVRIADDGLVGPDNTAPCSHAGSHRSLAPGLSEQMLLEWLHSKKWGLCASRLSNQLMKTVFQHVDTKPTSGIEGE